ncbi:MAG: hypothetical protein M0T85_12270 [Dehalococcoidales bacterium]|nr:hypothetical protein [Dehalococcoidales bacterium]
MTLAIHDYIPKLMAIMALVILHRLQPEQGPVANQVRENGWDFPGKSGDHKGVLL